METIFTLLCLSAGFFFVGGVMLAFAFLAEQGCFNRFVLIITGLVCFGAGAWAYMMFSNLPKQ